MKDIRARYGPWALIAGGSEGIGERLARRLADAGVNLVLVARRAEPLEAAAETLRAETGVEVRTLALDLTDPAMLEQIRSVTDDLEVGMLVYNAGVDNRVGDFVDRSLSNIRRVIDLNVIGQSLLAHHFGGLMRARGRGGMILVGALLGYAGGGGMTTYAATKAYIHTLAKGLWFEMKPHGVDVLGLVVGATLTPAYQRFGMPASHNGMVASDPDMVAREALERMGETPIWVPSDQQALADQLYGLPPGEAVTLVSANAKALQDARTT